MKTELDKYKEAEMLQLIRETLDDLHSIGDTLERYARDQIEIKRGTEGERDAGTAS